MCDRHPPFDLKAGDRIGVTLPQAVQRATALARSRRERQKATLHRGILFTTDVYVIQDAARVLAWEAERDEHR